MDHGDKTRHERNATSVDFSKVIDGGFFVRNAEVCVEKSRLLILRAVFCCTAFLYSLQENTFFFRRFGLNSHRTVLKKKRTQCDI